MLFGRNNSAALAQRDPARAALLGAITGATFGRDPRSASVRREPSRFGRDVGFGQDPQFGNESPWANVPGYNFGADAAPAPTPQAMQQAWYAQNKQMAANARREQLLEPNKDVTAKVERYAMPTSQAITIGTALNPFTITANPTVNIRPSRVVSNAPTTGFVFLTRISVANVNVLVGPGVQDAWDYAAEANGTSLDIPTLTPSNPITIQGQYTGLVPPAFNNGLATFFTLSFIGWASVTA
jgi:hypothetical protein